ncbi:hypothetical protein BGZ49_010818 [Haplosporangium sp. Z 27]|nr:hypothetical protein BGZ49_010818 [Haplosporangium sp. Z 27]
MSNIPLMRRLALSLKAVAPGGGRYPRRTVELADPQLSEANYDDANIAVQWQSWLRNTRKDPPTPQEIQRDETRKQLTIARAKVLDQAWQDRKAELALEQAQDRQSILSIAAASRRQASNNNARESDSPNSQSLPPEGDSEKSAARKQVEEREAARKAGFKPQVQQGDTFQPQAWSPTAARRR